MWLLSTDKHSTHAATKVAYEGTSVVQGMVTTMHAVPSFAQYDVAGCSYTMLTMCRCIAAK